MVSLRHRLQRDGPRDVGGMAVTPTLRKQQPKLAGQRGEVAGEVPAVGEPTVQQHQQITVAAFVIPHRDAVDLHVVCHRVTTS
jgi:hypothetical protein